MNYRVAFTISLATNLLLATAFLWTQLLRRASSDLAAPRKVAGAIATSPVRVEDTVAGGRAAAKSALSWADSMSLFREAGVPSEILAKLVVEKIAQKWTPLEKQFEEQFLNDQINAKRLEELHDQRARELDDELRLALGAGYLEWDKRTTVDNIYLGGLTPTGAQREALYPLQKDYLDRIHALEVAKRNGQLEEKTFAQAQQRVETDYHDRLVGIIGAERVAALGGQENPASQVRNEFSQLKLTHQQMDDLAAVQKKWMSLRASMSQSLEQTKTIDVAYDGDLRAIDHARDEEFSRILGPENFDAWQKSSDDRFNTLKNNARDWNLDQQQVDSVYKTVRAYDLAVANFEYKAQISAQEGKPVDWTTIEMAVAEYTQQTEATLRHYLGNQRFEQMRATEVFGLRRAASPDKERPGRETHP